MLEIQTFLKIFGSDGVEFVSLDTNPQEAYTGLEVTSVEKVRGFGIPVTEELYEVFNSKFDAEQRYSEIRGDMTSNEFIFAPSGTRTLQ